MKTSDYTYELPERLVANHPPKIRGTSRLLVLDRRSGSTTDRAYGDIVEYLETGDVLVMNNTKVIKARLLTTKSTGEMRELVLVEKHGKQDDWHVHTVIYRRSLKIGDELLISGHKLFVKEILGNGMAVIQSTTDLLEIAERFGTVPLPPYMHRSTTAEDIERYQTVFAKEQGSVAAPTASLNMTTGLLEKLTNKGVTVAYITLHVGLGTFLPIRVDDVTEHIMHKEYFEIPSTTVNAIQNAKNTGHRVIALGTTVARSLEYAHEQITHIEHSDISGEADIFIYPGYTFKIIDGLITNFHMPDSTVLMLTAALGSWEQLKPAYEHAIQNEYKFFSYGDSMLII